MPKKLIVNADDFGISISINRGIIEGHCHGIITSASVMAGGEAFDDACRLARENPTLDLGVHLTLDEEFPVLAADHIPTLVGQYGRLHARSKVLLLLLRGRIALDEVEREWSAQIKKCLEQGLAISHLDGHGHIHAFPTLIGVAEKLRRAYGIPYMRKPSERLLIPGFQAGLAGYIKKVLVCLSTRYSFWKKRISRERSTDAFVGLAVSGQLNAKSFWRLIDRLEEGLNELMTHPGHTDESTMARYGYWGYHWEEELAIMKFTAKDSERLKALGIQLTNFRDEKKYH